MNQRTFKKALAVGAVLAAIGLGADRAQAAVGSPSYLNIDVTISQSLSVAISTTQTSTMTYAWTSAGRVQVAATTTTVTNDSGGLTEKWNLKTFAQTNMSNGASTPWTLQASTNSADVGPEQFAVMAQFLPAGTASNGCPVAGDASWLANGRPTVLNTTAQIYGAAYAGGNAFQYQATTPDNAGTQQMYAYNSALSSSNGIRALCWKVIGPTSTANTTGTENIQIVITAQ